VRGVSEAHRVRERHHAAIELIGARWTGAIRRVLFVTGAPRQEKKAGDPRSRRTAISITTRVGFSRGVRYRSA
jgi:hypothetical protein